MVSGRRGASLCREATRGAWASAAEVIGAVRRRSQITAYSRTNVTGYARPNEESRSRIGCSGTSFQEKAPVACPAIHSAVGLVRQF
jgi:hypothetical protein